MTYREQEAMIIPLSIYKDYATQLEANADTVQYSTWSTCGRDYDDSILDELRSILHEAAERVRTALHDKLSELPPDIDKDLLRAYGLD